MIVPTTRLEYFSDGIIAIAITIMVLDIELTKFDGITLNTEWVIFVKMLPRFLIYLLSFAMLSIMWVNHHTLYHFIHYVDVKLMWHNLHLLFWLTLVPFFTSIMGKYYTLPVALAMYGFVMFMSSFAFSLSRFYATRNNLMCKTNITKEDDVIQRIILRMRIKINIGMVFYLISIPLAFVSIFLAYACFIVPAVLYIIPEVVENNRLAKALYNHLNKLHH